MVGEAKYERKTVQTIRGGAGLVITKLQKDGWELVDQTNGTVRTTLEFRRPKPPWWRTWIVAGAALAALVITAISVGVIREGDADRAQSDGPTAGGRDREKPTPEPRKSVASTRGKGPMEWGNWRLMDKIEVDADLYGYYDPAFDVMNTLDEPDTGYFTVTFLAGKEVLGTAECTTAIALNARPVPPGDSGFVKCSSEDMFTKGWTEITIEDTYERPPD